MKCFLLGLLGLKYIEVGQDLMTMGNVGARVSNLHAIKSVRHEVNHSPLSFCAFIPVLMTQASLQQGRSECGATKHGLCYTVLNWEISHDSL